MKTRTEIIENLRKHSSPHPTSVKTWVDDYQANKSWLHYSQQVAMIMWDSMEKQNLTQMDLAQRLGYTEQRVIEILRGKENMTIDTLLRIESVLDISILKKFPE